MKNKRKLLLLIPLGLIVFGGILSIVGLVSGALGSYKSQLKFTDFEANISSSGVYNLDIDVELADINIISTNDETDFHIVAHNVTKSLIDYTTNNNTLRLRYGLKKWYNAIYYPAYWTEDGAIDLYIPATVNLKDVEIESSCAIKITYLTADRIFITSGRGDCDLTNLNCSYTNITDNGGALTGKNIDADSADLNLDCTSAKLDNFVSESVIMNNDGTDSDISGIIGGNSSFYSNGGNVNITMYGELSDYNFNVLKGDVLVNEKEPPANKNGKYKIKLNGDINLYVK